MAAFGAHVLLAFGLLLPAGCVRFQPQPLSPANTAAELESRSLTNATLKIFLEKNLQREFEPWPPPTWDFETLTLAAFYYHPSLEVARADWQVATAGKTTAAERPNPTVTQNLAYEPVKDAFSPWIPGLTFDLPLETAGKRRKRMEQAQHVAEAARYNVATAAWQVRSGLRASLLDFIAAQARLELVSQQLGLREELVRRLTLQLQAGAISAFDLNTARLALLRARADVADAERLAGEARPRLAQALGVPVAGLEGAQFQFDLGTVVVENLTTPEARTTALQGRADILSALADYGTSQSALQVEVAKQYPDVHLTPGYMWNAGSTGENDWQIGATVELPLLNQHRGAIAEATARRNASAARFLALQARVIGEIDTALASFAANRTNAATLDALVRAQANQQQALTEQLKAGAVDRLEVLTSGLELNAAELTRLDAQIKIQQAIGALEDALQRPFELPKAVFETRRDQAR